MALGNGESGRPVARQAGKESTAMASSATANPLEECQLPPEFKQFLTQVGANFGIAPALLLGGTLVNSGVAIGNGVVLQTSLWPSPINASLGFALAADPTEPIEAAFEALSQALRDEADQRLSGMAGGVKEIEQQIRNLEADRRAYFGSDVVRNVEVEANFQAKIERLRVLLNPLIMLENPRPGAIELGVQNSGGKGLFVWFEDSSFSRFLDAAKRDPGGFKFLTQTWEGKTPEWSFSKLSRGRPIIRPVVGSLLSCTPGTIARLVCSKEPAVREFADQLIMARGKPTQPASSNNGYLEALADFWPAWIGRMVGLRDGGLRRRLRLCRGAAAALAHYIKETCQQLSEQERWTKRGPIKAAKVALNFHLWRSEASDELSEATMCAAIRTTRWLNQESAATACACAAGEEDRKIREQAAIMLQKLKKRIEHFQRPITRRDLYQCYDNESRALHDPVLEFLLRAGQVRWLDDRPDGRLEPAADSESGHL